MRRFTNGTFEQVAERHGMLMVYPNGVEQHFNDARATLPVAARELGIDDVAFTQAIVAQLREEFGAGRVFAAGFSNGGQFVIRLLFDAPRLLSGAAIFSATLGAGDNHAPTNPDSAYQPTPVIIMHGTADRLAPYDGGIAGMDSQRTRGEVTSAPYTAARFAQLNTTNKLSQPISRFEQTTSRFEQPTSRLKQPPESWESRELGDSRNSYQPTPPIETPPIETPPIELHPFADTTVLRWEGKYPVELWTIEGMGHLIPSGNELDPRLGANTSSFLAAEVVEDFFGL